MTDIEELIFEVIDDVNDQLPAEEKLEKSMQTVIVGDEGKLDSLGVINFLVSLEEKVVSSTGKSLALMSDELFAQESGVLHTVSSIKQYISDKM
jgi:hypothetical protein